MAARVGVALVAVLVVAWLAVLERDTRVEQQSFNEAAKGKLANAESGLQRAGFLNPDTQPDVIRSQIFLLQNNRPKATSVIDGVLSREPDNVVAWNQLLTTSRGYNAAAARRALAEIKRLDPLDAPSR